MHIITLFAAVSAATCELAHLPRQVVLAMLIGFLGSSGAQKLQRHEGRLGCGPCPAAQSSLLLTTWFQDSWSRLTFAPHAGSLSQSSRFKLLVIVSTSYYHVSHRF